MCSGIRLGRLSSTLEEAEAQFLKKDGAGIIEVKTPAADAMERNNSPLVTNDLMELQLPPVRGPTMAATVGDCAAIMRTQAYGTCVCTKSK